MNAEQTNIKVGQWVTTNIPSNDNDSCLNGIIGEATHPFANGCTDKGWVGIRVDKYTHYGNQFNAKETELIVITDSVKEQIQKIKDIYPNIPIGYYGNGKDDINVEYHYKNKSCNILDYITIH